MTKAEKATAAKKAVEMTAWTGKQWAAFHRQYAAQETVGSLHEIDREAYKQYMVNAGLTTTEAAGGHYAMLNQKAGASYVDYTGMLEKLKGMGIDTDALVKEFTKKRADTLAFSFK